MKTENGLGVAWLILTCLVTSAGAQMLAIDFSVTDRDTGEAYSLSELAGHVIVIDFFAYWCGPCQSSSPILEQEVSQYFSDRGGNAHGIPVRVIPVNMYSNSDAATETFVQTYGLSHAADDRVGSIWGEAWSQFGLGYIPHFVVINGVADSTHYQQWEVLHSDYGFPGSAYFRGLINTVDGSPPVRAVAPPVIQQVSPPIDGAATVTISGTQTDVRYFLEWDSGDGDWRRADPVGRTGNGSVQSLTHRPGVPGPPCCRYRVNAIAE